MKMANLIHTVLGKITQSAKEGTVIWSVFVETKCGFKRFLIKLSYSLTVNTTYTL